jgi:hypothetical protein
MAFQLAIRNCFKHPFNQEKSAAGKKWLLSLRTPERYFCSSGERFYIRKRSKVFFLASMNLK